MTEIHSSPHIASLNVGQVRVIDWHGEPVTTAIWKSPVSGRVLVHGVNFAGDDQADRSVHGGPDKAVYAYASEDYTYWSGAESFEVGPAVFGENLTTQGIDLSASRPGDRWRVGSAILEVVQPRLPCYKLGIRVGDSHFLKRFLIAARPGAYLRVIQEGDVAAGDGIQVISRPAHSVTMRTMVLSLRNRAPCRALRDVEYLPSFWREMADHA
jgi:MOSC domain-containing protein YiiM